MTISILAIGKARGAESAWGAEYHKRLGVAVTIRELTAPKSLSADATQKAEAKLLLKAVPERAFVVLLDERGKNLSSRDFAATIAAWQTAGNNIVFVIGGADGVTDDLRRRADFMLSFGAMTWPHRLARVMLLEQIYRARQITGGHPYHRD